MATMTSASPRNVLSLEQLARMSFEQLARVYEGGSLPQALSVLNGNPQGRMLAVRFLDRGPIAAALRRVAGDRRFVWEGKSFSSRGNRSGSGINRVHLAGRHKLFPFTTRAGKSAWDGHDTIILDYDHPDNPLVIRRIHDEIREVSPGLFLGPAMWKTQTHPRTILWFALDATTA